MDFVKIKTEFYRAITIRLYNGMIDLSIRAIDLHNHISTFLNEDNTKELSSGLLDFLGYSIKEDGK